MNDLGRTLWQYRYFILSAIRSELKGRFARSKLGALWFILHPLAQAAIYAIILSKLMGAKLTHADIQGAYPIYLMSGMAAWGLFSEITNRCLTIFIEYAGTLKKISFPRLCLPFIVWGSVLTNHILLLLAMVTVFAFFGHFPTIAWLSLPLGSLLISMLAFGLGVMLGIFNVYARDVAQFITVVMQIWFWLTPIVYTADVPPENLRWLIQINPMAPLVRFYQDVLLYQRWPDLASLLVPVVMAAVLFLLSFVLFRRASPDLVDAL